MATEKISKIKLSKKGAAAQPGAPLTGTDGEETLELPPPAPQAADGMGDAGATATIQDPMKMRDTPTSRLQRVKSADETAAAVKPANAQGKGTETVKLKVVKEKKKQLPNVISPGQTVHLRPSSSPEGAVSGADAAPSNSASATVKATPVPTGSATPTGVLKIISRPKAARGSRPSALRDLSDKSSTRTLRIRPGQTGPEAPEAPAAPAEQEAPVAADNTDTHVARGARSPMRDVADKASTRTLEIQPGHGDAEAPPLMGPDPNLARTETKPRSELQVNSASATQASPEGAPVVKHGDTTEGKKLSLRKPGAPPIMPVMPGGTDSKSLKLRPAAGPAPTSPAAETVAAGLDETSDSLPSTEAPTAINVPPPAPGAGPDVLATQIAAPPPPGEGEDKTGRLSLKLKGAGPGPSKQTVALPGVQRDGNTAAQTQMEPASAKRTVAVPQDQVPMASETIQMDPPEAEEAPAAGPKKKGLRLKTGKKADAGPPSAEGDAAAAEAEEGASAARSVGAPPSELGIVSVLSSAAAVLAMGVLTALLVKQVLDHLM